MPAPAIARLEDLLAGAFGRPVRIAQAERLAPWSAIRRRLESAEGLPASVIAKWLRDGDLRADPRQVATEQAALEFLAAIGFPLAPRLVAADRAAELLILEDLAPREPLAELIRRKGAAACAGELLAFADAMGALGAATAGRGAEYDAVRTRHGPVDPRAGRARGLGPDWPDALVRLQALGLPVPAPVERELAGLVEALLDPGPFLALSNGDPEANNVLVTGDDARLIDFEAAAFRHALASAAWMHVPGPAWISVAHPMAGDLEAAYRRALARGVAEAEDDHLFGRAMATACLASACERLSRFARLDARPAGDLSRLQMVSTLEAAAGAARRHRSLPVLAGWMERAAGWLRRRWPDADLDLAAWPPYAPRP